MLNTYLLKRAEFIACGQKRPKMRNTERIKHFCHGHTWISIHTFPRPLQYKRPPSQIWIGGKSDSCHGDKQQPLTSKLIDWIIIFVNINRTLTHTQYIRFYNLLLVFLKILNYFFCLFSIVLHFYWFVIL